MQHQQQLQQVYPFRTYRVISSHLQNPLAVEGAIREQTSRLVSPPSRIRLTHTAEIEEDAQRFDYLVATRLCMLPIIGFRYQPHTQAALRLGVIPCMFRRRRDEVVPRDIF